MASRDAVRDMLRLYAVTDSRWLAGEDLADVVRRAIEGGVTCVQLREKDVSRARRVELAREVGAVCRAAGVPFLVDDDVACALEAGADGVHVGQQDSSCRAAREALGPDAIVGVSAQTVEQALAAQADGADYLGVGAVFPTATKTDAQAVGLQGLRAICAAVDIPVVAIGGVGPGNVAELAGTGAAGAAVVSAIFASDDVRAAARGLRRSCDAAFAGCGEEPLRPVPHTLPAVLTIAGSDSSGGAGIQADLKTIDAHLLYGESVICALTAQNTRGVAEVLDVDPDFVTRQIDCVFEDIPPSAVKVGMLSSAPVVRAVARGLERWGARNVVVDPVMVATSGGVLLHADALQALREELLPLADVVTPNIPEACALSGLPIAPDSLDDMARAAREIAALAPRAAVLVKGGHQSFRSTDVLLLPGAAEPLVLQGPVVETANTHGTGCTLSSAIACGLATGLDVEQAVRAAKAYLGGCLASGLDLGAGSGPVDHLADLRAIAGARA